MRDTSCSAFNYLSTQDPVEIFDTDHITNQIMFVQLPNAAKLADAASILESSTSMWTLDMYMLLHVLSMLEHSVTTVAWHMSTFRFNSIIWGKFTVIWLPSPEMITQTTQPLCLIMSLPGLCAYKSLWQIFFWILRNNIRTQKPNTSAEAQTVWVYNDVPVRQNEPIMWAFWIRIDILGWFAIEGWINDIIRYVVRGIDNIRMGRPVLYNRPFVRIVPPIAVLPPRLVRVWEPLNGQGLPTLAAIIYE